MILVWGSCALVGCERADVGGYGGLVPEHFRFGDLSLYFLGSDASQWPKKGEASLLGCECGEVGCWPLNAGITVNGATVTWSRFQQPYRPDWDYSAFGPFEFDRQQYENAVHSGMVRLQEATRPFQ